MKAIFIDVDQKSVSEVEIQNIMELFKYMTYPFEYLDVGPEYTHDADILNTMAIHEISEPYEPSKMDNGFILEGINDNPCYGNALIYYELDHEDNYPLLNTLVDINQVREKIHFVKRLYPKCCVCRSEYDEYRDIDASSISSAERFADVCLKCHEAFSKSNDLKN